MNNSTSFPLSQLPRRLKELTGHPPPSYRRCYALTVDARLPSEIVNGRHYVRERDLASIAEMFGLPIVTT